METGSIDGRVITESFALLADGSDVHRFAGMKNRCENESLSEGGLEITGYEGMEMRGNVGELKVCSVLEIFRHASCRSAELHTEDHTALVIKTIAKLGVDRVGSFVRFDIARIDAGEEFVVSVSEDFLRRRG